jgi:NAD(P)-dependent dehydrogenase (short-subunit alcohol dehydrogenase family)
MSLQGKVVAITGAAGSLGRAVAGACHAAGARLILLDLQLATLQRAYPEAEVTQRLCATDLMDEVATGDAIAAAVQHFGGLHALCNIAGGFAMGPAVHATDTTTWQWMQDLNVGTLLNAVRAAVPAILASGGGSIVNIGAGAGQKGSAQMGAYSAAKSAVIRITEAMAGELREQGINVNCVLPSIIDTPANRAAMPDADPSRWVAPQDLANVIRFLCSTEARAIHGAAIPVVGLS